MKKHIVAICLNLIALSIFAQQTDIIYNYPVRPGTPEWEKLTTKEEQYSALEIPESLIEIMNTESLVVSCVNAPYCGDFLAYDGFQTGMSVLIGRYNSLQELINRSDAPAKLLEMYQQSDDLTLLIQHEQVDIEFWTLRRMFFEMLLAQEEVIVQMTHQEQIALLREAQRRLKLKQDYNFDRTQTIPSFYIIEKVLLLNEYPVFFDFMAENEEIKTSVDIGFMIGDNNLERLLGIAEEYITENTSGICTKNIRGLKLSQNFPNPFSAATTIELFVPENISNVNLHLYNYQGIFLNAIEVKSRGVVQITISRNDIKSGVYFYSLVAEGIRKLTKQMIIND